MRRRESLAALAAAALLTTVGAAASGVASADRAAAAPALRWSTPVTLARGATGEGFDAAVVYAPGGAGAIAWRSTLATLPATGAPRPQRSAPPGIAGSFGGLLATYGRAHLVALWDRARPASAPDGSSSVALDASLAGGRIRATPLHLPYGTLLAAASNTAGIVAVAYESCYSCARANLLLAMRAPGAGRLRPSRTVMAAPRHGGGPSVANLAVGPGGTVLVAWEEEAQSGPAAAPSNVVYARLLLPDGTLTPTARLGGGTFADGNVAIAGAVEADGNPIVAFESDGEGCEAPGQVTVHAAGGDALGRFARPQLLDSFPSVPLDGYCLDSWGPRHPSAVIGLAQDPDPIVVWTGSRSGRLVVDAAKLSRGRFGATRLVSPPDGRDNVLAGVAGGGAAAATALWASFPRGVGALEQGTHTALLAATATSGDAFGVPAVVAGPGPIAFPPSLAVDPAAGKAVAAWTALPVHAASRLEYSAQTPVSQGGLRRGTRASSWAGRRRERRVTARVPAGPIDLAGCGGDADSEHDEPGLRRHLASV